MTRFPRLAEPRGQSGAIRLPRGDNELSVPPGGLAPGTCAVARLAKARERTQGVKQTRAFQRRTSTCGGETNMADVRERKKIAREIERRAIRKKHHALKTGRIEKDMALDRHFKPIIKSLQQIVDSPGVRAIKRQSHDDDAASAFKRERKEEKEEEEEE
ncbi:hypothetical protein G5I_09867 [Acromyrmex echinatior]|uniref:Uncharacterized protein n=1 Tax=Acromyrmex echinatior TaxID=103372 RepID=F4WVD2_ACREC|nr:hypothetical protein G5I_09867 [Acromyrmex echinatior]